MGFEPFGATIGALIQLLPSGDTTGTIDTAVVKAAASALPGGTGRIVLGPGNWYIKTGQISFTNQPVFFDGAGRAVTTVFAIGSGICVSMHNTTFPVSGPTIFGGGIRGITFDGTNASNGAVGFELGDGEGYELDVGVQNFAGTGSIGAHINNTVWWTEKLNGLIIGSNCTQHVVFDVTGATTSTSSFAYCDVDIVAIANPNQDGVVFQNGAFFDHGTLELRGNFEAGATAVTNGALRLTGTVPVGHPGAGTGSTIIAARLDVMVECNNSVSSNFPPQTIILGGIFTNGIFDCYGILDFTQGPIAFALSNLQVQAHPGSMSFNGPVAGDTNLNKANTGWVAVGIPFTYPLAFLDGSGGNCYFVGGDFFSATLSANITININPGNNPPATAQRKTVIIKQAAAGGPFTVTWPHTASPTVSNPTINWPGGVAPTMTAAANAVDMYEISTIDGATWIGRATQNVS